MPYRQPYRAARWQLAYIDSDGNAQYKLFDEVKELPSFIYYRKIQNYEIEEQHHVEWPAWGTVRHVEDGKVIYTSKAFRKLFKDDLQE